MSYNDALNQDKPIVILFKMKGCSACKAFEPKFDEMASKKNNKFNFVKEDCGFILSPITKKLNISSVPVVYILEPKTRTAAKLKQECMWDAECFSQTLEAYKKN